MRVVVLGAGYGTRLEADLAADGTDEERRRLHGLPKPLLSVGGRPLLSRWLGSLADFSADGDVWVVHNELHAASYRAWAAAGAFPSARLVNDGTRGNDARLGALRDLALALDASQPRGERAPWPPVLVVAGDTLFRPDFHLAAFVASGRRAVASGRADLVLTYYGLASAAEVSKRGVLELGGDEADEDGLRPVLRFMEKPQPSETPSRMACPPLYIYSPRAVDLLAEYLAEHSHQLSFCDAPGSWIPWLLRRGRVLAYGPLSGRFDIGSLNDYRMADAFFLAHEDR